LLAKTAANAWALRTLQPDAGAIIDWTNPAGVAGNPIPVFSPQDANEVLAGPASGSPMAPAFRALVGDDLPMTPAPASPVSNDVLIRVTIDGVDYDLLAVQVP
jgi:hypothetical protein